MSRVSMAALVAGLVLFVGAPLAADRIGGNRTEIPNPFSGLGGSDDGASASNDTGGVIPKDVPQRGTLITPAQAVPPRPSDAPFTYIQEFGGEVARWDPCTPITYVVRRRAGPKNGFELVQEALQRVSNASGLSFQFRGFTNDLPDDDFFASNQAAAWIGWAFDDEVTQLDRIVPGTNVEPAGIGGPTTRYPPLQAIAGKVVIRADAERLEPRFGSGPTYGHVLMHEIGHMVGLGHSSSARDVMFGQVTSNWSTDWGPGDLAGLYAIGSSQPCFK